MRPSLLFVLEVFVLILATIEAIKNKRFSRCSAGTSGESGSINSKRDNSKSLYVSRTRNYCLGVVESFWSYAQYLNVGYFDIDDDNVLMYLNGTSYPSDDSRRSLLSISKMYKKVLLQQYQWDSANSYHSGLCNWSQPLQHHSSNGFLGPSLRGVVGDTISLHVKSFVSDEAPQVHAHSFVSNPRRLCVNDSLSTAISYNKPIEECIFNWYVNYSSSTGRGEQSSTTVWPYTVDFPSNDGSLTGVVVVVNPKFITSEADADAALPCDVDQEFLLYLVETDETQNRYFQENLEEDDWYQSLDSSQQTALLQNITFLNSQLKYSVNGLSHGTLGPHSGLVSRLNTNVRWHILGHSYGTSHSPPKTFTVHWHGNILTDETGKYIDTVTATEGQVMSFDMSPGNVGLWDIVVLAHASVAASMRASYRVVDAEVASPAPSTGQATTANHTKKYSRKTMVLMEKLAVASAAVFAVAATIIGLAMYRSYIEARVLTFMGMTVIPDPNSSSYNCCLSPFDDLTSASTHPTTALVTNSPIMPVMVHVATVPPMQGAEVVIKEDSFAKRSQV